MQTLESRGDKCSEEKRGIKWEEMDAPTQDKKIWREAWKTPRKENAE